MFHRLTAIAATCLFLLLFVPLWRTSAAEGMALYRCNIDGEIEFRQTACREGVETRQRIIYSSSGLTPSEPGLRLKKTSEKTDTVSRRKTKQVSEKQCWNKHQQLDRVERRLRTGYRASEYQRLHDRQQEYEAFIHRFCR
jgi:hypothetical protein